MPRCLPMRTALLSAGRLAAGRWRAMDFGIAVAFIACATVMRQPASRQAGAIAVPGHI
jgi:hypothetical protein